MVSSASMIAGPNQLAAGDEAEQRLHRNVDLPDAGEVRRTPRWLSARLDDHVLCSSSLAERDPSSGMPPDDLYRRIGVIHREDLTMHLVEVLDQAVDVCLIGEVPSTQRELELPDLVGIARLCPVLDDASTIATARCLEELRTPLAQRIERPVHVLEREARARGRKRRRELAHEIGQQRARSTERGPDDREDDARAAKPPRNRNAVQSRRPATADHNGIAGIDPLVNR